MKRTIRDIDIHANTEAWVIERRLNQLITVKRFSKINISR
jgi:hypothetical protein